MIQVKEIINYQEQQEDKINSWIKNHPEVKIIDIKYSVAVHPKTNHYSDDTREFSGALIIYETKGAKLC